MWCEESRALYVVRASSYSDLGNELTTTVVLSERSAVLGRTAMYRGLSVSPKRGYFAPGTEPVRSDVEDLIAGREREIANFVHQAVFERLIRGEKQIDAPASGQNLIGNRGSIL